jgi:site-specific DNA-methyltransferase (adenine-specific)
MAKNKFSTKYLKGHALDKLREMATGSVDCVVTSPPYFNQRSYEGTVGFKSIEDYLYWSSLVIEECCRVAKGAVCWNVEGYVRNGSYLPLPELVSTRVFTRGHVNHRKRAVYYRFGTPGGNPDALADHHEIVLIFSGKAGRLHYSNPKACGHPPKFEVGGQTRPRGSNDDRVKSTFKNPKVCKASNVISCGAVGSHMDETSELSKISCENEAPFSYKLARTLVRTYCPPTGTVLDPFCGSGMVLKEAAITCRNSIGIDIRQSQIDLAKAKVRTALKDN